MLFNSPEFLLFFPIVFGLYWFVVQRNLKAQNALLLVASYVFYGWWDWRFLGLIALSTVVDFLVGLRIDEADEKRTKKAWLWVSLAVNLGLLGYFKSFRERDHFCPPLCPPSVSLKSEILLPVLNVDLTNGRLEQFSPPQIIHSIVRNNLDFQLFYAYCFTHPLPCL